MFITTSSVLCSSCAFQMTWEGSVSYHSLGPAEAESLPSLSPCGDLSDPEPTFITLFLLPKIFIRCWDSDWGQQAVTKMAL